MAYPWDEVPMTDNQRLAVLNPQGQSQAIAPEREAEIQERAWMVSPVVEDKPPAGAQWELPQYGPLREFPTMIPGENLGVHIETPMFLPELVSWRGSDDKSGYEYPEEVTKSAMAKMARQGMRPEQAWFQAQQEHLQEIEDKRNMLKAAEKGKMWNVDTGPAAPTGPSQIPREIEPDPMTNPAYRGRHEALSSFLTPSMRRPEVMRDIRRQAAEAQMEADLVAKGMSPRTAREVVLGGQPPGAFGPPRWSIR